MLFPKRLLRRMTNPSTHTNTRRIRDENEKIFASRFEMCGIHSVNKVLTPCSFVSLLFGGSRTWPWWYGIYVRSWTFHANTLIQLVVFIWGVNYKLLDCSNNPLSNLGSMKDPWAPLWDTNNSPSTQRQVTVVPTLNQPCTQRFWSQQAVKLALYCFIDKSKRGPICLAGGSGSWEDHYMCKIKFIDDAYRSSFIHFMCQISSVQPRLDNSPSNRPSTKYIWETFSGIFHNTLRFVKLTTVKIL